MVHQVLVIDDDEDDYFIVSNLLRRATGGEYEPVWARSFGEGLSMLKMGSHDVCLLDYRLGPQTGLDLLDAIEWNGREGPVILLTGSRQHGLDISAMRRGVSDYLVKDELDPDRLERSLRYAIERSRMIRELRASEERLALAMRGTNDGLWDWSVAEDTLYLSPRWNAIVGRGEEEVTGTLSTWLDRVHPVDRADFWEAMLDHVEGATEAIEHEHRILVDDGGYRWVLARGIGHRVGSEVVRIAGSLTDLTRQREAEDRLSRLAFQDEGTNLPNRSAFVAAVDRARPFEGGAVLAVVRPDGFDRMVGSMGRDAAEIVLSRVADRIEAALDGDPLVARVGGSDLGILMGASGAVEARDVASRIQDRASGLLDVGSIDVVVTVSVGLARLGADDADVPALDLVGRADAALAKAVALGAERCEVYEGGMVEDALTRLRVRTELSEALDEGHLLGYIQPIVDLADGAIVSGEMLARWPMPDGSLRSPGLFIPVAEEFHMIERIDRYMLRHAGALVGDWITSGALSEGRRIAVNISAGSVDSGLLRELDTLAERAGGHLYGHLRIEVTESTLLSEETSSSRVLWELAERGVSLAIDDFGKGFSSFDYLHRVPADVLKLDMSLVRQAKEPGVSSILRSVIALAHDLGFTVVAEGIETEDVATILHGLGCDHGQGFLYARPLDAQAFATALAEQRG